MLLSAVSVLVVAQSSSEIPEGLMNNPVYSGTQTQNLATHYLPQLNNMWMKCGVVCVHFFLTEELYLQ